MELRSGRRLGSSPRPQPRRRRQPPGFSDGGGPDRISDLPDEMLLHILVRLRCARAAAHTSGVSPRWRGLWRHLPELSFRNISADALEAALSQVASPALSLLEVDMPKTHRVMDPARVAALLRAAARLAPADLVFRLWGSYKCRNVPVEIPCFERATSVKLKLKDVYLTLPAGAAEFSLLERLSVSGCECDTAELVLRCPRLRVLHVSRHAGRVKVHSPTIEELVVKGNPSDIDIKAPVLKRFRLWAQTDGHFPLSFSAPMVENISWIRMSVVPYVGFGENWIMLDLHLVKNGNICVLDMSISSYIWPGVTPPPATRSFSEEIAQLPAFSALELCLETEKHQFGALVSHLLGICSTIKSLKISTCNIRGNKIRCSPNCSCDQPTNWRHEIISLTALEQVEITGFAGTDDEVDFLKLLFRSAPLMKRMKVEWVHLLSPTSGVRKKIHSIFKANPDVKCSIYHVGRYH